MPIFRTRRTAPARAGRLDFNWDSFSGGLNTLYKDTEIKKNELAQATDLMLIGDGIPTKRWGTGLYYMAGDTGSVRGLSGMYLKDGTNELLSITDDGYLTKKSNASYALITGVSWASAYPTEMAQLGDKIYIVNEGRNLAKYDGTTLTGFATVGFPASVFATQISGVSGTHTYSYRLTHVTDAGETAASASFTLANQPEDPSFGSTLLSWSVASNASIIVGTNIYGRSLGQESFLASVDGEATEWIDSGDAVPAFTPFAEEIADTTGGITAKYVKRFKDRLVYAGIPNYPTRVMISARYNQQEKFDLASGGGLIDIEPDSGDDIVGLETKGDKILVFKEHSIWQITLSQFTYKYVQSVGLTILQMEPSLITNSIGCAGQRTIAHVENDILFLASGGRGVYVLGNEPGIIGDILRTNEVSVKVRPFFEALTPTQESNACAAYFNNKYFIGVPGKGQTMVFDRERNAWMGPWSFDANIFTTYYDSNENPVLVKGNYADTNVMEIDSKFRDDNGTAFDTVLRTRREDMGDWSLYKNVRDIFTVWRNVTGSVSADVRLEQLNGNTITAKSFTVTTTAGNSGWGADQWANTLFADSEESGNAQDLSELVRRTRLNKHARNLQMIVKTTGANDDYELMSIKGEANLIGETRPLSWKV